MVRARRRAPAHQEEFALEAVPMLLHITKLGDHRKRLQMCLQSRPCALRHPVRLSDEDAHALKAQSIAVLRLRMPGRTTNIREIIEEGEGELRRVRGRSGRHVGSSVLVIGRSGKGAIDIHFVSARLKAELRFAKGAEETSCVPCPPRRAEHVSVRRTATQEVCRPGHMVGRWGSDPSLGVCQVGYQPAQQGGRQTETRES